MKGIKQALKARLAQKNMAKLSIGAFILQLAKKSATYPDELGGYVRWNTLFLTVWKREDKTARFLQRETLRSSINQQLQDFGYDYILKEIRLK